MSPWTGAVTINASYVTERLGKIVEDDGSSRYIHSIGRAIEEVYDSKS